jgi:hypothetical protein
MHGWRPSQSVLTSHKQEIQTLMLHQAQWCLRPHALPSRASQTTPTQGLIWLGCCRSDETHALTRSRLAAQTYRPCSSVLIGRCGGEKDAGNHIDRGFGIGRNLLSISLLRFYAARVYLHRNRLDDDEPSITSLLYGTPTVQHVIWTAEHLLQALFTSPSQPKIFSLPPITSNLSTYAWSIKCR